MELCSSEAVILCTLKGSFYLKNLSLYQVQSEPSCGKIFEIVFQPAVVNAILISNLVTAQSSFASLGFLRFYDHFLNSIQTGA